MTTQSSFHWPMRLVPEDRRAAVFAIYGWCRHLDDLIDGPAPDEAKARALATWRDFFAADTPVAMDQQSTLVAATLGAAMAAHRLPPDLFLRVLEGMEMDLAGDMRAPVLADLARYAHAVASAPGEMCLNVLGWNGEPARAYAAALGEAMQFTNILRDVEEDAAQGRLYIPREALDAAGIVAQDPAIVLADPRFGDAWLALALMAEAKFHQADSLAPQGADRRVIRPVLAMGAIYRALWRKLRARGWRKDANRAGISKWHAAAVALKVAWLG